MVIATVKWSDLRQDVYNINPILAGIIDNIDPPKECAFFRCNYEYGENIVDDGVIQLPSPQTHASLASQAKLIQHIQNDIQYAHIPLALSLNRTNEVYLYDQYTHHLSPLNVIAPGVPFGVFEVLDVLNGTKKIKPNWNVSSGARSVFMLEKLSDARSHARLQRHYGVTVKPPQSLFAHFDTFVNITRHHPKGKNWRNTVLIFNQFWFNRMNDIAWLGFKNYLQKLGWEQSEYIRKRMQLSILWKRISGILSQRKLKHSAYVLDTVRYLTCISLGITPGFQPIKSSDMSAPVDLLEDAYLNCYGLQNYIPIFMHCFINNTSNQHPIYYSLNHPMLLEGVPKTNVRPNIIDDLLTIKNILDILSENTEILSEEYLSKLRQVNVQYFHAHDKRTGNIQHPSSLPEYDPNFMLSDNKYIGKSFPVHSPFFCGCIGLTN